MWKDREMGWGGMDWNHLAQDRDQWWALANSFGFYKMLRNSEAAEQLVASQE
jgi:hypothetical protein